MTTCNATLAEHHQLVLQAIDALYPQEPPSPALAAEVKQLWNLSERSDPPAGKEFAKQIDAALELVSDCAHRGREIAGLRAETGRTLSTARRAQIAALHDELRTLLEQTAPHASVAECQAAELSVYRRKARLRDGATRSDP
jgi:hypothetical protein